MASSENSIYLAKNVTVTVVVATPPSPPNSAVYYNIHINDEDVNLNRHPELSSVPALLEAIRAFILKLNSPFMEVMVATTGLNGPTFCEIALFTKRMQQLWRALPESVLEIRCGINVAPGSAATGRTFRKRLVLSDVLKKGPSSISVRHCIFSTAAGFVRIGDTIKYDIILAWPNPSEKIRIGQNSFAGNLFGMEASKDLVIVAGNGTEIKCHRLVLGAHSDALAAMVSPGNGMEESKSGRIHMAAHSEEAVTQFIRYLYGFEVNTQAMSCDAAVQLFKLSDMYTLPALMASMGSSLLKKGTGWYTPDTLLELHFHVKNLDGFRNLYDHSLRVMLNLTQEIRVCERFRELERTDARAATGLVWLLHDMK